MEPQGRDLTKKEMQKLSKWLKKQYPTQKRKKDPEDIFPKEWERICSVCDEWKDPCCCNKGPCVSCCRGMKT